MAYDSCLAILIKTDIQRTLIAIMTTAARNYFSNKGPHPTMNSFTHFDDSGASRMVDTSEKSETERLARAQGKVTMHSETLKLIQDRRVAKGDVLGVARLAGIMAAKKTSDLIPLCHPLPLTSVTIDYHITDDHTILIEAVAKVKGRTGVEMEALTAVSVTGLTIYDMCKSADRTIILGPITLLEKKGGKSGHFQRPSDDPSSR